MSGHQSRCIIIQWCTKIFTWQLIEFLRDLNETGIDAISDFSRWIGQVLLLGHQVIRDINSLSMKLKILIISVLENSLGKVENNSTKVAKTGWKQLEFYF